MPKTCPTLFSRSDQLVRLVMMGTGTFALPTFQALCRSRHAVVGLVTQPDRTGRGHHHHPHPMKEAALAHGVPVFQPENANAPESLDRLREFQADIFVVAAYGQILSPELLAIPPRGAYNLHASLLPKYRGAAPIQYAVWNGDSETGVVIFRIEPRLDAGPILAVHRTPILPHETSGDVEAKLADAAGPLMLAFLDDLERGDLHPVPQDVSQVSRARKIRKEQGLIDWSQTARQIDCHIRAMQPWPVAYTFLHAPDRPPLRTAILRVTAAQSTISRLPTTPGSVTVIDGRQLFVTCGDGAVEIIELQPAGKRAQTAAEFLRGHAVSEQCRFGGETLSSS
jgi:methionyl-tRNA formyltransferase